MRLLAETRWPTTTVSAGTGSRRPPTVKEPVPVHGPGRCSVMDRSTPTFSPPPAWTTAPPAGRVLSRAEALTADAVGASRLISLPAAVRCRSRRPCWPWAVARPSGLSGRAQVGRRSAHLLGRAARLDPAPMGCRAAPRPFAVTRNGGRRLGPPPRRGRGADRQPTPYGTCADIEGVAHACHARGRPLIVDEACGAHFRFDPDLTTWAMNAGADICVVSVHKMGAGFEQARRSTAKAPWSTVRPVRLRRPADDRQPQCHGLRGDGRLAPPDGPAWDRGSG